MNLTSQQKYAIDKFSKLRVGALFMEMGTGKTLTAINLAEMQKDSYDVILWLSPVSIIESTKTEIQSYKILSKPILYCGYQTIASSDKSYLELCRKLEGKRVFLICDESIFLKNGDTKRWKRVYNIRQEYANFCLLLNGTPMSRDEMDIYWQMQLLSPLIFNMSEAEYRSIMFKEIKIIGNKKIKKVFHSRCQTNLPWLKSCIAPYIYECSLKIPVAINEQQENPRITAYTEALYQEEKKNLIEVLKNYDENGIMGSLSKMKHLVASDRLKNDQIAKYITERQVIVFCEYRSELERIVQQTKNGAYAITGDTPIVEREEIINNWKKGSKPLVTMTACTSYGLNLQEADEVVFASLPWDYGTYTQALHRVYRLGQKSTTVKIIQYIQRIGIMRMVEECLWKKLTLAEYVKKMNWKEYIND